MTLIVGDSLGLSVGDNVGISAGIAVGAIIVSNWLVESDEIGVVGTCVS